MFTSLPELSSCASSLRISPELDVPVTKRVKSIIDCASFRRLERIRQLGLVSLVYPGATHTRFEHSLGVYRNAIHFVQQLSNDSTFRSQMDEQSVLTFLLAALLHDIGHWPYCHAIEDMRLTGLPRHESISLQMLHQDDLYQRIENDWGVPVASVAALIDGSCKQKPTPQSTILQSMLSGPIDIDKLDYLERDSLHAGVPYGRNFDRNRLIRSLCIHPELHTLALTEKGKTASEMLVFARYIMFSEVYWHHAVRSGTAMLQRGIFEMARSSSTSVAEASAKWQGMSDEQMSTHLLDSSVGRSWAPCVEGLFGGGRKLYKRLGQFDCLSHPGLHAKLARRPYETLVELSNGIASRLSTEMNQVVNPSDILIDAPPVKLEVQFQIQVLTSGNEFRPLGEISPMVKSLATKQFDDIVKRVRVFAKPEIAVAFKAHNLDVIQMLEEMV